jgi:hypothetical protein
MEIIQLTDGKGQKDVLARIIRLLFQVEPRRLKNVVYIWPSSKQLLPEPRYVRAHDKVADVTLSKVVEDFLRIPTPRFQKPKSLLTGRPLRSGVADWTYCTAPDDRGFEPVRLR